MVGSGVKETLGTLESLSGYLGWSPGPALHPSFPLMYLPGGSGWWLVVAQGAGSLPSTQET